MPPLPVLPRLCASVPLVCRNLNYPCGRQPATAPRPPLVTPLVCLALVWHQRKAYPFSSDTNTRSSLREAKDCTRYNKMLCSEGRTSLEAVPITLNAVLLKFSSGCNVHIPFSSFYRLLKSPFSLTYIRYCCRSRFEAHGVRIYTPLAAANTRFYPFSVCRNYYPCGRQPANCTATTSRHTSAKHSTLSSLIHSSEDE